MKKLGKFMFSTLSVVTLAAGAYYIYNNLVKKDSNDDFDDFDEEYCDDIKDIYTKTDVEESKESRDYVSIPIDPQAVASVEEVSEIETEDLDDESQF